MFGGMKFFIILKSMKLPLFTGFSSTSSRNPLLGLFN